MAGQAENRFLINANIRLLSAAMINSEPLSPLTPHMISCLHMYETRFFSYKGDFTWSFYLSQLKRKEVNICIPRSACRSSTVRYWQHLQLPKGSPRKISISPTCLDMPHCQSHFHLPSCTAGCKAQGYRIGTSAREAEKLWSFGMGRRLKTHRKIEI